MKRGIVLEGGGAKGAFEVGALKAIHELNISYSGVVGASIGAINGAILAMQDMNLLEDIWLSTEASDIIKGDEVMLEKILKFDFRGDMASMRRFIIDTIRQGGLDVTPYRKYLKDHISEERVRASEIAYGLVTLSLTDLKPIECFVEDIPEGKLHDYIIASANFPAFKSDKIDDKYLLDGGFFDNLPINMLLDKGYDEIIAIRVMGMGRIRRIKKTDQHKVITILPSEDLGKTLEIDPKRAAYNIRLGYYDAYRVLKNLKGAYYYIVGDTDEDVIFNHLCDLPLDMIQPLQKIFGYEKMPKLRFIFEILMPLLSEVLGCSKDAKYSEIILSFFETLGREANVDRFSFMTLGELSEVVLSHYQEASHTLTKTLDTLSKGLLAFIATTGVSVLPKKQKQLFLNYVLHLMIATQVTFKNS